MKRVLLILGVVILIGLALVGFAVYRANDLIAKFKPQLEAVLGNAVGAQVSLGEIDVSIIPSTELKAAKVTIKQKGDGGEGLVLNNLILSLELTKLLTGQIAVSRLELDSPSITAIKTVEGTFIEGLARPQRAEPAEKRPVHDVSDKEAPASGSSISIDANDISVRNGTFTFKDSIKNVQYQLSSINLKAAVSIAGSDIVLPTWNVAFKLEGDVPVTVSGKGTQLKKGDDTLTIGDVDVSVASGTINLNGVIGLKEKRGTVVLNIRELKPLALLPAVKPFVPDTAPFVPLVPIVRSVSGKYDAGKEELFLESAKLVFPGGEVTSSGSLLLAKSSGSLSVTAENFDLSTIPEMLKSQAPVLGQYALKGSASPKLEATFNPSGFGIKGPIDLKGIDATISGARPLHFSGGTGTLKASVSKSDTTIDTKDFSIGINGAPLSVTTTLHHRPAGIEIPFLNLQGFGGTIGGTFVLKNDVQKSFSTVMDMKKLDISQLLAQVDAAKAAAISGTLSSFKGKLSGSLNPGGPQTWNGTGAFEVSKGLVKDLNIPGVVLKKIDNIPLLAGTLSAYVPERFKPVVNSKDTPIQRLAGSFDLASGLATIKGLVLDSDHFSLQGDGNYNLAGPMDLDATIFFSKEFSAALVASAKEIRNILDKDGKLVIPLTLKGVAPGLSITPNTAKLLELAAKGTLRTQAGDALEKTLEKKLGTGAGKDVRKTLENLLNF